MFRTPFAALFAMLIFLAPAAASGFYVTGFGGANQRRGR